MCKWTHWDSLMRSLVSNIINDLLLNPSSYIHCTGYCNNKFLSCSTCCPCISLCKRIHTMRHLDAIRFSTIHSSFSSHKSNVRKEQ
ncbi:hypothetical protein SCLCIDRAFT_187299 [Scleroderma citrinum Foug A]|uniref:Uncharacterized protein n=1 Tax=Scleroderma citrinum Foug A TaxID=1036808 RepID=A0A0C2ZXP2_9AGAM|nr:hypothetical protein SCLCIDRAFT_187299 [Scleroderma citrinum Foug A]